MVSCYQEEARNVSFSPRFGPNSDSPYRVEIGIGEARLYVHLQLLFSSGPLRVVMVCDVSGSFWSF
jgi:hypothetical protein